MEEENVSFFKDLRNFSETHRNKMVFPRFFFIFYFLLDVTKFEAFQVGLSLDLPGFS